MEGGGGGLESHSTCTPPPTTNRRDPAPDQTPCAPRTRHAPGPPQRAGGAQGSRSAQASRGRTRCGSPMQWGGGGGATQARGAPGAAGPWGPVVAVLVIACPQNRPPNDRLCPTSQNGGSGGTRHTGTGRTRAIALQISGPRGQGGWSLPQPTAGGAETVMRGGGFGMSSWCVVPCVQLAAPIGRSPFAALFPWTLSLRRRWRRSASHRPVTFLFLFALPFPLYFPFLSLGRLCQWRDFHVSLLSSGPTRRRATALAVGQVRPSGHPKPAVWDPSPTAAFRPWDVHLRGSLPAGGHITTFYLFIPALSPPCGERIMHPLPPVYDHGVYIAPPFPCVARVGVVGGGWRRVLGGDGWFLLCAPSVGRHDVVGDGWRGGWRRVRGGDGWFLLCAPSVGRHDVVGDGWRGGWRRVRGGDGLVPPGVVGGVRRRVVWGSVRCGRGCGLGHLPCLAPSSRCGRAEHIHIGEGCCWVEVGV